MRRGYVSHYPALQSLIWTGGQVANIDGWASVLYSSLLGTSFIRILIQMPITIATVEALKLLGQP